MAGEGVFVFHGHAGGDAASHSFFVGVGHEDGGVAVGVGEVGGGGGHVVGGGVLENEGGAGGHGGVVLAVGDGGVGGIVGGIMVGPFCQEVAYKGAGAGGEEGGGGELGGAVVGGAHTV